MFDLTSGVKRPLLTAFAQCKEGDHPEPARKKQCFSGRLVQACDLDLLNNITDLVNVRAIATGTSPQECPEAATSLEKIINLVKQANTMILESKCFLPDPRSSVEPDSPMSIDSPVSFPEASPDHGFIVMDRGVVHGKGVVATRGYKANDEIAVYSGTLTFRVPVNKRDIDGKYNVFQVVQNDDSFSIRFLKEDTFVAWSNCYLRHSGGLRIEMGRDGDPPIRYLNHSKKSNVMIVSKAATRLFFHECDNQLKLSVIALRDINKGEELTFDYAPEKPDAIIDFSQSTVEEVRAEKESQIISVLRNAYRPVKKNRPSLSRCTNEALNIPKSLDAPIDQIIDIIKDYRRKHCATITLECFFAELSDKQKELLRLVLLDGTPDLEKIGKLTLKLLIKGELEDEEDSNDQPEQLTREGVGRLVTFLEKQIFNNNQTGFSTQDLREILKGGALSELKLLPRKRRRDLTR